MTIRRKGAFITYGPEDLTPGHSPVCSYQLGDPKKCPVCKTWPKQEQGDGPALAERIKALSAAVVALADGADKCAAAPHFIVQPFLAIYKKHGNTIAEARAWVRLGRKK